MKEQEWMPPFASGKIYKDYSLLKEYLTIAKERGREDLVNKATLHEEDYRLLSSEAKKALNAYELIEKLSQKLRDRIDKEIACEAARRLGLPLSPDDATDIVARQLAAWLIEAGDHWGIIRIKGYS